jgi:adenylylsulfate kinase-like enzyme
MAWALWVTGLPATGKSWLSKELVERLHCEWLRLDVFRKEIVPNPTFSEEERKFVYEKLAERAADVVAQGKSVLIDATDNLGVGRKRAKELIKHFGVVQLHASAELAQWLEENKRGTPLPGMENLYARAKRGEIPPLPGVTAPYVEEEKPLVLIKVKKGNSVQEWADKVVESIPW